MNTVDITDLLKGCRLIRDENGEVVVQSILNMQLVCLTTDDEFSINKFANPLENVVASNRTYGHLRLRNTNATKATIVPAQIAILTKNFAQNHAMVKGAYLAAKSAQDFNDAGCVQGSQTGHINESDNEMRFVPFGAREYIFEMVGNTAGFENAYKAINKVGQETGANSGTYLDKYYKKFDKKLEEFIAHFERPERCIGTMVLIEGEIVAVDKFPSFEYCEQIWDMLIRDCYGSIAITQEIKTNSGEKSFSETLKRMRKKNSENTGEFLKRVLSKTKSKISERVQQRLEDFLELNFDTKVDPDSTRNNYNSNILKTEGYIGQVISEGNYHHLVSIVKKDSFNPKRFREANVVRNLAKKQNKFSL